MRATIQHILSETPRRASLLGGHGSTEHLKILGGWLTTAVCPSRCLLSLAEACVRAVHSRMRGLDCRQFVHSKACHESMKSHISGDCVGADSSSFTTPCKRLRGYAEHAISMRTSLPVLACRTGNCSMSTFIEIAGISAPVRGVRAVQLPHCHHVLDLELEHRMKLKMTMSRCLYSLSCC